MPTMHSRWLAVASGLVAAAVLAGARGSTTSRPVAESAPRAGLPSPSLPPSTAALAPGPLSPDTPSPSDPGFHGSVARIDGATRTRMAFSWHDGCPVPVEDLRLLSIDYWGFDGLVHSGEMVVHRDSARDVVRVFGILFEAGFAIHRMRLVDDYQGDDDRSMAADNTSAFNCRAVTGGSSWSEHAYGRAIDVNPRENPYITEAGTIEPPAGARYADRSLRAKGMIHARNVVVEAFASVGWGWGGSWSNPTDYQHFSSTGR